MLLHIIFEKSYSSQLGHPDPDYDAYTAAVVDFMKSLQRDSVIKSFLLSPERKIANAIRFEVRFADEISVTDEKCLDLFEALEKEKSRFKIGHFDISQSPLKEVFESIIGLSLEGL